MNYSKSGTGEALVLLHGWGGSWQSWGPVIDRLKRKFTVYAVDLPGFGLSPLLRPYNLDQYAEDIVIFCKEKKLRKIVLVGHSFGGQVGAKFTLLYPKLVKQLILVDAAISRDNSNTLSFNIALTKLGKKILANALPENWLPMFRKWYYQMRSLNESDYFLITNEQLKLTASNIFREDLLQEITKITTPTLIFWGQKDEATPLDQAKEINRQIKNSVLKVVPGGHFSYLDNLDTFVSSVIDFIK